MVRFLFPWIHFPVSDNHWYKSTPKPDELCRPQDFAAPRKQISPGLMCSWEDEHPNIWICGRGSIRNFHTSRTAFTQESRNSWESRARSDRWSSIQLTEVSKRDSAPSFVSSRTFLASFQLRFTIYALSSEKRQFPHLWCHKIFTRRWKDSIWRLTANRMQITV